MYSNLPSLFSPSGRWPEREDTTHTKLIAGVGLSTHIPAALAGLYTGQQIHAAVHVVKLPRRY